MVSLKLTRLLLFALCSSALFIGVIFFKNINTREDITNVNLNLQRGSSTTDKIANLQAAIQRNKDEQVALSDVIKMKQEVIDKLSSTLKEVSTSFILRECPDRVVASVFNHSIEWIQELVGSGIQWTRNIL